MTTFLTLTVNKLIFIGVSLSISLSACINSKVKPTKFYAKVLQEAEQKNHIIEAFLTNQIRKKFSLIDHNHLAAFGGVHYKSKKFFRDTAVGYSYYPQTIYLFRILEGELYRNYIEPACIQEVTNLIDDDLKRPETLFVHSYPSLSDDNIYRILINHFKRKPDTIINGNLVWSAGKKKVTLYKDLENKNDLKIELFLE